MSHNRLTVFTANANPALAHEICENLGIKIGRAMVRQFADGETYLQIQENVRGADVFVIQSTCTPVDRHLMELLLMIDALKRASAGRITAVMKVNPVAIWLARQTPGLQIVAQVPNDPQPLGIGFAKSNTALLGAVNQALQAMTQDGSYTRLTQKWGIA